MSLLEVVVMGSLLGVAWLGLWVVIGSLLVGGPRFRR